MRSLYVCLTCGIVFLASVINGDAQTLAFTRSDCASYTGARGIVTADFDRDGRADLAHTDMDRNSVTILLNQGGPCPVRASEIPVGAGPFGLATADFNRDGMPDLAVANATDNSLSVLIANGTGSFTRTDWPAPSEPRAVLAADLNNDGKPDIVSSGYSSGTILVLLGDGAGAFTPGPTYLGGTSSYPQGIAAADFDRDGFLDVAVANASASGLEILYGNGGSAFTARAVGGDTYLNVVATGDFNGDGWTDVAAASTPNSSVAVFLGTANGLVYSHSYLTGASPRGIIAVDIDNDGRLDLVTANRGSSTVSILLADPANPGMFRPRVDVAAGSGSRTVVAADFNRDGRFDLATGNEYATSVTLLTNATEVPAAITRVKIAFYNIDAGKGKTGLTGSCVFESNNNCTDTTQPMNAWGMGVIQQELARFLRDDPSVIAMGLAESWKSLCASPEQVRAFLGWKARTSEQNGVALLAKYGFAGPIQWQQLDTSLNANPADTMWVVTAPVCVDAACTRALNVYATHWLADLQRTTEYEIQAQQTVDFISRLPAGTPRVLVGDLNVFEGVYVCRESPEPTVLQKLKDAGYVDGWPAVHGTAEGYTSTWNRNGCGVPVGYVWKRIDQAWSLNLPAPVSMERFGMVTPGYCSPSDHSGIVVEYQLPGPVAAAAPVTARPALCAAPEQ